MESWEACREVKPLLRSKLFTRDNNTYTILDLEDKRFVMLLIAHRLCTDSYSPIWTLRNTIFHYDATYMATFAHFSVKLTYDIRNHCTLYLIEI